MSTLPTIAQRTLEHEKGWRRLAAISVTGNAREAQRQMCIDAGFDETFTKPFKIFDLVQSVARLTQAAS